MRARGCRKLVFYNVSQDFRIGEAIRRSRAQGVTFGWYPTGLNSGRELAGNYLRGGRRLSRHAAAASSPGCPASSTSSTAPICGTRTMYPAMARTFRSVGAQFAAMFSYDMLQTASRNLGWQTHYLNLAYTPRKAMSAVIAAEAMRRLPRMRSYGGYPGNTRFGDFRISHEEDLAELVARDAFLYAGSTRIDAAATAPRSGASRGTARLLWSRTRARAPTSSTGCAPGCGGSRCIPTRCRCATRSSRPAPTRS